MPRIALSNEQRIEYKVTDFKGWVVKQMKINGKRQEDVAKALGVSQGLVSRMLKIPKNKEEEKRVKKDPFSYGQVIALCELFSVDENERKKLLTL